MLITFANRFDREQTRQKVGPDLDPNCLTLRWYSWKNFRKKNQKIKKNMKIFQRQRVMPQSHTACYWDATDFICNWLGASSCNTCNYWTMSLQIWSLSTHWPSCQCVAIWLKIVFACSRSDQLTTFLQLLCSGLWLDQSNQLPVSDWCLTLRLLTHQVATGWGQVKRLVGYCVLFDKLCWPKCLVFLAFRCVSQCEYSKPV